MAGVETEYCVDCQLSNLKECDNRRMLAQIQNAVGLSDEERLKFEEEQLATAAARKCPQLQAPQSRQEIQEIALRHTLGSLVTKNIQHPGDPVTQAQIDNLSRMLSEMEHSNGRISESIAVKDKPDSV